MYLATMSYWPIPNGARKVHDTDDVLFSERTYFTHRLIPGTPDPWRVILSTMVPAGLEFWQDTAIVAVTELLGLTLLGLRVTDTLQLS